MPRPGKRRKSKRGDAAVQRKGFVLTVAEGLNPGKEYFFEDTITIGRVEQNDIILVQPGISRQHARVLNDQGVYIVEDLGSANGTRLNGEQLSEQEVLRDGDYITMGPTTLQFSQLEGSRGEVTAKTSLANLAALAKNDLTREQSAPSGLALKLRWLWTTRAGWAVMLLVGLLAAGGGTYALLGDKGVAIVADQSDVPMAYSDEDSFFNAVFGYGKYDKSHITKVIIDFEYLGGRVTLRYGAWGIDKVGEVEVLLNDKMAGQVPVNKTAWEYGRKLVMPREGLKKGKTNRITFKNTRNPDNEDKWEICYIQIDQEAIPPPNPSEARLQFELGNKAWQDREIEPGNMYTALVGFKKTRNLLEGLPSRPDLYQEAEDMMEKVDRALTKKFNDGLFSARRAEKLDGDPGKARSLLIRTRRYFRRDDFRYREIQRYLDALSEL